jgi:hypothetical protein
MEGFYMKYKYTPKCHIIDYETGNKKFVFDDNGIFETGDPKLIEWIRKNKPFLKPIQEEPKQAEETGGDAQAPSLLCPYCGLPAKNKSGLSAHIRAKHKEE